MSTNKATVTAEQAAVIADLLKENRQHLEALERALDVERRTLTAAPFVIGFPQYGIYCDIRADEWGVVRKVNTNGIRYATRLSREDADRLTRNGNIRNGNGETAVVVGYTDALAKQVEGMREIIADLASYLD